MGIQQATMRYPRTTPPLEATGSGPIIQSRIGAGNIIAVATISASGGTGSYTYNTVWLSGGSDITLLNSTTATPGVSSSGSPPLVRTGTMRTTVSDGTSSVNVDTSVSLTWEN